MTEHDPASFILGASSLARDVDAMLQVQAATEGYHAVFRVDPSLSILEDHFPHQAIVPGICMIQAALLAAARVLHEPAMRLASIKSAKMTHPVLPGNVVDLQGVIETTGPGQWLIKTKLTMGQKRVAELSLVARRDGDSDVPAADVSSV